MKKTIKLNFLARAVTLLLLTVITATTAWAQENTTFPLTSGQTWTNTTTNTKYTVSGTAGNLTLTASVADANVNDGKGSIGMSAFYEKDMTGVKNFVINEGIETIYRGLFSSSTNNVLSSLSIPASVTSIEQTAFEDCYSLASVTIANGSHLQSIGTNAFKDCYFSSIVLPCTELTSVSNSVFNRTSSHQNLSEIICLTEASLVVDNNVFYNNGNQVTVYMLGSKKVNWNRAKAVKGLVKTVEKGTNVSSLTADYSAAIKKTVGGTDYYVGGSTVKLTLTSSLTGDNVVFRANGVNLVKGNDGKYTLTLPDDATTVTVTASAPQSISTAVVTLAENSYTFDTTAKEPAVSSVTLGGTTLTAGTEYTVSYEDNIAIGTAKVIVTGCGNYDGTVTKTFAINAPAIGDVTYNSTGGYYEIATLEDFNAFAAYINSLNGTTCETIGSALSFRLTQDIGSKDSPVGSDITPVTQSFYGTFDGQGHTIYGINISSNEDCFGLFRYAYGIIKRLTLADATVTGTSSVGGIAGLGPAKIEDCHVSGSIIGSSGNVGGIIAWAGSSAIIVENSYVKDCTFSGSVTGMQNVGGIVGYDQFSSSVYSYTIDNCTVTNSTLHGNNSVVGGIVGVIWTGNANTTTSRVKNCKLAQTTVTETNSGTEHGAIVGQMKYQAATVVSGCVYHSTDQSLTGIGSSSEGSNNDTGCSRVYSLNREVGITVSQVSGTTATIGGTAYYANGATITLGHNRPGQIFGNYVSSDVTITDDTFTMPAQDVSVSATWTTDPDFSGNNDESEYTINNATGWNNFCDLLAGGETFNGKTVKLGADIGTEQAPITRMAGPNQFCGNFNGGNHKLTFNYTASGNYSAPFASVKGGSTDATAITISNLNVVTTITATDYKHAAGLVALQQGHVNVTGCNATVNITSTKGTNTDLYPAGLVSQASSSNGGTLTVTGCTATGTISTDGKYAAGLVGILQGAATITDCVSSVTINSSTSGDGTHGGIVGSNTGAINIYGTVFNGRLLGTATECVGGFIGWRHGGANIYNSLFAPTEVTVKTDGSATFARNDVDTHNCYYTYYLCDGEHYVPYYATDGITRRNGYAARTVTAGENVTVAVSPVGSPVENGTYSVSGITAYAKGITRTVDDATTFYYGSGDAVSLTLQNTPPQGYALSGYEASKGTLTGTENPYTLTMPDEDVTVSATWTPSETLNLTANLAPDENYWTTFYCGDAGYTIDGGENACAYTATYSDGKLTLHNQGKEIPQGTAVIIVADNAEVSMTKANLSAFSGTNHLRGVDVDTPTDDIQTDLGSGTFYVLGMTNDHFGFHKYTGATMAARKAFVLVNGSNALARSLTVVFEDATGITTTNFTNGTNSDATWYNLDGRRLSGKPSQRGVYVNNGKKIVIK